jgi:hypothetical protein
MSPACATAFWQRVGEKWQVPATLRNLRYAVNQEMARLDSPVGLVTKWLSSRR